MATPAEEADLLDRARAGDVVALERLLLGHHDRLERTLARRIPADLRSTLSVEDVLQEAYAGAFQRIATFISQGDDSIHYWLLAIAEHRLLDLIKAHRSAKRGGGRLQITASPPNGASSIAPLYAALAIDNHSPSGSVAEHEAHSAVTKGLNTLPDAMREVLRLRFIEGLAFAEVAARVGRTEGAVHMLCQRGLAKLRISLGGSSRYFSD